MRYGIVYCVLLFSLFGTPAKLTYWTADFAPMLLDNMHAAAKAALSKKSIILEPRARFFMASREQLFAIAGVLGVKFHYNGSLPAVPAGGISPGTSLFFELHDDRTTPYSTSASVAADVQLTASQMTSYHKHSLRAQAAH